METAREMLKPFRSDNGHFEFYFQFDDVNKGRMFLTYLKSKTKPESFDFEIDTNRTLSIKGILISDPGGHTSITSKEIEECIEFLKTGIMDKAAIYHN